MNATLATSIALVLALSGTAVWLHGQNQDLGERLAQLEARLAEDEGALGTGDPGADGAPGLAQASASRMEVERLARRLEVAEAQVATVGRATGVLAEDGTPIEGARVAKADGAPSAADDPALDRAVRDIVLDMAGDVRFRTKLGLRGSPNLPKKPAFAQLAEALSLDADQEARFRKDLMGLKEDFLAIISEERSDGVVPLELIAEAEEMTENDPRRAQLFVRLFTMKIPGSEETYMTRLIEMTSEFRQGTNDYFRPDQRELFGAMDVDLLGVEMGN